MATAKRLATYLVGSAWKLILWSGVLCSLASLYVIDRRDPDAAGLVLWLMSMVCVLVAGLFYDRGGGLWHRLGAAVQWRWVDWLAAVALTAIALALRLYLLDQQFPAMHGDEGEMGMLARLALYGPGGERGPLPLPYFRTGFLDHPTLYHYLQAGFLVLLGDSVFSLKLLSASFGALCAPLVYAIGRIGWGRVAGLVGGWLLAVSHLHIHYSRIALNNIQSVWFAALFILLVVLVYVVGALSSSLHAKAASEAAIPGASRPENSGRLGTENAVPLPAAAGPGDRRLTLFVLIGLVVGLSQYFYYGSRLIVLLALVLLPLLWRVRRAHPGYVLAAAGSAMLAFLPMILFYRDHLTSFINRTRGVSVFNPEGLKHTLGPGVTWPRDIPDLLLYQIERNVAFFVRSGDHSAFYLPMIPAFDLLTVALFWLGLGVLISQWRRFPAQAVLLWLILGVLLGGILTNDAPNGPRLIVAATAAFVLGGVAVHVLYEFLGALWPDGRRRVALAVGIAGCAFTLQTNYTAYFETFRQFEPFALMREVAYAIEENATGQRVYLMGGPNLFVEHGVIRFIVDGAERYNLFEPEDLPAIYADAVAAGEDLLIIVLPHRQADLNQIQAAFPAGTLADHTDRFDRLVYYTYRIPVLHP